MPVTRHLFLLGGVQAFPTMIEPFYHAMGGADGRLVILAQSCAGWEARHEDYAPLYRKFAPEQWGVIAPEGQVDIDEACALLHQATGVYMGGGYLPEYQRHFATEPLRSLLRERYAQGMVYAGISAGALLAQEQYVASPEYLADGVPPVLPGLGFLTEIAVQVHYTEWGRQPALRKHLDLFPHVRYGLGMDEATCVVFLDEEFHGVLGGDAYRVVHDGADEKLPPFSRGD